jgi:hypothetical protein
MAKERIFQMKYADIYDAYLQKITRKGRDERDLRKVTSWLTGYDENELVKVLQSGISLTDFFAGAKLNENANKITGTICGVRVENVADPLMKQIRQMDKLVDELAKGQSLEKILRK